MYVDKKLSGVAAVQTLSRLNRTHPGKSGKLALDSREGVLEPFGERPDREPPPQEMDALSTIIRELNVRFGTEFSDEDKVFIEQLEARLDGHEALAAAVRANPPENSRLTFEHVVRDQFQELIETNFDFYKRVTDDETFAKVLLEALFARFVARVAGPRA